MIAPTRVLLLLVIASVLAACGGQTQDVGLRSTPIPRTATPVATALPSIATSIPAGLPDNPLLLLFLPVAPDEAAALERRLEEELLLASNVTVDVQLVGSYAESLQALCNSNQGIVAGAWVDGLTYAAAIGQNCGTPALQLQVGTGRAATTGQAGVIVLNAELGSTSLAVLEARPYCRIGFGDFFSWVLPTLMMRADGVDPLAVEDFVEFETYEELLNAVALGECAGTGVPAQVWEEYAEDASDTLAALQEQAAQEAEDAEEAEGASDQPTPTPIPDDIGIVLAATSVEFPYAVLMLPFETPLAARLSITDGLAAIDANGLVVEITPEPVIPSEDEATQAPETSDAEATAEVETVNLLEAYLRDGIFVRVEEGDFDELNEFLESTGLNFSRLGD